MAERLWGFSTFSSRTVKSAILWFKTVFRRSNLRGSKGIVQIETAKWIATFVGPYQAHQSSSSFPSEQLSQPFVFFWPSDSGLLFDAISKEWACLFNHLLDHWNPDSQPVIRFLVLVVFAFLLWTNDEARQVTVEVLRSAANYLEPDKNKKPTPKSQSTFSVLKDIPKTAD